MKNTKGRKYKKKTIEDLAGMIDSLAQKMDQRSDTLEQSIENLAMMTRREFDEHAAKLDGFIVQTEENFKRMDNDIEILRRETNGNFNRVEIQFERVNNNISAMQQLSNMYVTRPELQAYFEKR
jgi:hypothetical protein